MSPALESRNQHFSELMDLDSIAKQWARKILDNSQGLTRDQRQRLSDVCRKDRKFFSRSCLNLLIELAPFASAHAATWGPEAIRGSVVGRLDVRCPTVAEAYAMEEESNAAANIAQQIFREQRTKAAADVANEMFEWQALATRQAQDATWRAIPQARSIHVVSR